MIVVTQNVYEANEGCCDGDLTQTIAYVDDTTQRVTNYTYDWRDRLIMTTDPLGRCMVNTYDNLGRVTQVDQYSSSPNGTPPGTLIGQSQTLYDNRGLVYATVTYGVDPGTGTVGPALADNFWHDAAGNVIVNQPAGSQAFTKSVYDGVARNTNQYVGYGTPSTPSVADDTIFAETDNVFDPAGNLIQQTTFQRFHNATGIGPLNLPAGPQPQARASFTASWLDGIGQVTATANYGTNNAASFLRPATAPASSDTILVTSYSYDNAGNLGADRRSDGANRPAAVRRSRPSPPDGRELHQPFHWRERREPDHAHHIYARRGGRHAHGRQFSDWRPGDHVCLWHFARQFRHCP